MKKLLITSSLLAGSCAIASAQTSVASDIETDTVWNTAGSPYILEDTITVKNDAVLTIRPGVIVRGQPRSSTTNPGSLIVSRNGKIYAEGSSSLPVVFTTAAIDKVNNLTGAAGADNVPDAEAGSTDYAARFVVGVDSVEDFYDVDPIGSPLPPLAGTATVGNQAVDSSSANFVPGGSGEGLSANIELWGGLILLGNAPSNLGTAEGGATDIGKAAALEGHVEGLPNSEDTAYGGLFANDSSGVLEYVSVRHGGEVLGSDNEINGITLAGVGFGTKIENCEVYLTYDDGFEWFGGTVNGRNLMVTFAGDDQFDGDQGWIGQVQNVFAVLPYFAVGSGSGDKLFEFDGQDGSSAPDSNLTSDGDVFPFPSYAIANFTAVGQLGATGNTVASGSSGSIDMKAGYSGDLYNGIIVNTGSAPFLFNSLEPISIDSVTLKNVGSQNPVPPTATVANIVDQGVSGAGLVGEDSATIGGLDPRPSTAGFPAPAGVDSDIRLPMPFETTYYRGAFAPDAEVLWTTGWTALNLRGILAD